MPDSEERFPMLSLTEVLRPPRARVGKIFGMQLGRTIEWRVIGYGAAGAVAGLFPGTVLAVFLGGMGVVYGIFSGIMVGVGLVTWQPTRGETAPSYLVARARQRGRSVHASDGRDMKLYVGMAPVSRVALGYTRIYPSAVPVAAGAYDERGVPVIAGQGDRMRRAGELSGLQALPARAAVSSLTPASSERRGAPARQSTAPDRSAAAVTSSKQPAAPSPRRR